MSGMEMSSRERFLATSRVGACPRTPRWELGFWSGAIQRWCQKGLPGAQRGRAPNPGTAAPGVHVLEHIAPAPVEFVNAAPPQPFFLPVGCSETHRRFARASSIEDPRYCFPPRPIPDTPETRRDMGDFKASAGSGRCAAANAHDVRRRPIDITTAGRR